MNVKQDQERKKRRSIWSIIGGIVFVAGICAVMPMLIQKASDYFYSKRPPLVKPRGDDDWGPEIVKKRIVENADDGEI